MLTDLLTVINLPVKQICWQIIRKGKSADRFIDCHQICQLGNLLAEMGGICL